MNVLYIGPYRQTDEWGATSLALLNLLNGIQEINLVARPVWFNNQTTPVDIQQLTDLEYKEIESPDVLIQYGLPSFLNYDGRFKTNIAITSVDCRVDNTDWIIHLNLFDKVVVFSEYERILLEQSGVKTKVVAFKFPPYIASTNIQQLDLNFKGKKFYTIGTTDVKNGFHEVLVSYLSAFSILDNTILLVATPNAEETKKQIDSIKQGLGIFNNPDHYAHIALINSLDGSVINFLHNYGEYYIDVSYNSRISQNILRAIANDSIPIILDTCKEAFPNYEFLVKSNYDLCVYGNRPIHGLYSGKYAWAVPSMLDLKQKIKLTDSEEYISHAKFEMMKFKSNMIKLPNETIREVLCIH